VNFWWLISAAQGAEFFEGYGFYLGEPHAHTGYSVDGGSSDLRDNCKYCGAFADFMPIARENGLDFVVISDHDTAPGGVRENERHMAQPPYGGGLTIAMIPEEDQFDRPLLQQAVLAWSLLALLGWRK